MIFRLVVVHVEHRSTTESNARRLNLICRWSPFIMAEALAYSRYQLLGYAPFLSSQ
jgi:hypothetical protein